jgi:peptidoglycan/xylan/chitin deacetylase (PgdA/CDA1 family)
MASIALKVDVDTDRGTAEGVPRLARELERLGVRATFLFSLGPDNTGRAMRRVFRKGFLAKVRRTSVIQHYGLRTLLYGTLLPAPDIGRRRAGVMRSIANAGFEVGVHTYDHVKWQDCVGDASYLWTCWQLQLAVNAFGEVFGRAPRVHGAAGWQLNEHVPALEETYGFQHASDTRGTSPFLPWVDGVIGGVPQFPTTLPTLDELVGRPEVPQDRIADHVLALTRTSTRNQVFTLHAELEGGAYLPLFLSLLQGWRAQGHVLGDLAAQRTAQRGPLAVHSIRMEEMPGRSGVLAVQGDQVLGSRRGGPGTTRLVDRPQEI